MSVRLVYVCVSVYVSATKIKKISFVGFVMLYIEKEQEGSETETSASATNLNRLEIFKPSPICCSSGGRLRESFVYTPSSRSPPPRPLVRTRAEGRTVYGVWHYASSVFPHLVRVLPLPKTKKEEETIEPKTSHREYGTSFLMALHHISKEIGLGFTLYLSIYIYIPIYTVFFPVVDVVVLLPHITAAMSTYIYYGGGGSIGGGGGGVTQTDTSHIYKGDEEASGEFAVSVETPTYTNNNNSTNK
eukprot:gene7848-5476_t